MNQVWAVDTYLVDFTGWLDVPEPQYEGSAALQVSPNPFSDQVNLTFNLPQNQTFTIRLYDITGKERIKLPNLERNGGISSWFIPTQDLPAGIYLLTLRSDDFSFTRKLIKSR